MLTSDGESSNAVPADNIDCGGPPNRTGIMVLYFMPAAFDKSQTPLK